MDLNKTASYDYDLPKDLIATKPIYPRDSAKLLVYDRNSGTITHDTFKNILSYIPDDTAFVLNDTKVIKARIFGKKESGGKIELLLNKVHADSTYEVLIRGRVKTGSVLQFDKELQATVLECKEDGSRVVSFTKKDRTCEFTELVKILDAIGHIPLPPYIQRADDADDSKDYQSTFSKNYGAVAAPTASLHFTPELFKTIQSRYKTYYTTLHVGAGTFKPVSSELITDHTMHSEYYEIPKKTQDMLQTKQKIVAVGTTVTRTVEYFARTQKAMGDCDLFLHPNNPPQRVDHLLTNFHLPKSTLIMLVASFVGVDTCKRLYKEAVAKRYRFFSYGDAMLII